MTDEQKQAWDAFQANDILFLIGSAGTGKAQSLNCKIYTPDGYKTMGEIETGDTVLTPDGKTASVVATFPQGEKDLYQINFADGGSTQCCLEHLWKIEVGGRKTKIVNTQYIIDNLKTSKGRRKISIPYTKCVNFSHKPKYQ